jgi:EF hand
VDPDERMTADEAFGAAWLNRRHGATTRDPLAEEIEHVKASIIKYSHYPKLKRMALMEVAHQSTSAEIGILRKMFQQYDTKRDGQLSYEEFKAAISAASMDTTEEEHQRIFDAIVCCYCVHWNDCSCGCTCNLPLSRIDICRTLTVLVTFSGLSLSQRLWKLTVQLYVIKAETRNPADKRGIGHFSNLCVPRFRARRKSPRPLTRSTLMIQVISLLKTSLKSWGRKSHRKRLGLLLKKLISSRMVASVTANLWHYGRRTTGKQIHSQAKQF